MKKYSATVTAVLLALSLVLPLGTLGQAWAAVDTKAIDLNLQVLGRTAADDVTPEGYKVYRFLSGEPINLRASFKASGTDVDLPYGSVKITFPQSGKSLVENFNFVDSRRAKETIQTNDPNTEHSVRYQFTKISGGDVGAYPISFNFKNLVTPNGERQLAIIQVLDEQGNVVPGKEMTIAFEAQAGSNYQGSKWRYYGEDHLIGRFDTPAARPQTTPAENGPTTITFYNGFVPNAFPGAGSGRGEYMQGTLKVVETIPEGAVLTDHPDNQGWVQDPTNPRVYTKEKPANELPRDHNGRLIMPMVLAFPNQPYKNKQGDSYYTDRFVNSSEFFYDDGTGFKNVGQGTAAARFYVSPPPPPPNGEFDSKKWSNQGNQLGILSGHNNQLPVLVNVARKSEDITALWQTEPNNPNSAVKVWPQDDSARKAFTWTTNVWSNKRPDKEITASTGEKRIQPGVTNHTDYIYAMVHYHEIVPQEFSRLGNGQTGLHFKDFTLHPAEVASIGGYEAESEAVSTAQWINDNIKYDLYLTRVNHWANASNGSGLLFRQDWENAQPNAPITNILPGQSRLVKSAIRPGETVKIDDFGGYYNAVAVVFSNPELQNARPDGTVVNALPLRDAQFRMTSTSWPVVAGGASQKADGTTYVAPPENDWLANFSKQTLDKLDRNDRTGAQNMRWITMEHLNISYTTGNGDIAPTTTSVSTPDNYRIGRDNRRGDRWGGSEWHDNAVVIAPNFGKLGLNSSTNVTKNYSQDPESMRTIGSFEARLSPDTISAPDLSRIKNMKGVVLLPPGVLFRRSVDRAGAIADPIVVNNYRNTGRQAIVYDFGDYRERSTGTIQYELQITGDAKDASTGDGKNLVDTWVTWDNNDTILAQQGMGNTADELSMNSDGKRTDQILHRQYNITVNLPQEVFITKYVANPAADADLTKPEEFEWTAYSPFNDIDTDLYYQVRIVNKFTDPIIKATIADVMPRTGDSKMVANEAGEYPLRGPAQTGSIFATPLSGPIEDVPGNEKAADKFAFTYSTAPVVQENPNFVPEDSWKTAAEITGGATDPQAIRDAWKNVTAWRAVLREGKDIPALPDQFSSEEERKKFKEGDNEVPIFFKARVENNKDIPVDSRAFNSVASMLDSATKFQEANEVEVSNVRYVVDGHAFRDIRMSGDLSNNRVAGVTAQLVYATAGTDSMGNEYAAGDPVPAQWVDVARRNPDTGLLEPAERGVNSMVTDADGYYSFITYKRGDYTVKFTRPDQSDYRFIQCGVNEGSNRANTVKTWPDTFSSDETVSSTTLTVNPSDLRYNDQAALQLEAGSLRAIRNAALHDAKQDLVLKKTGLDVNGKETGNLGGTTFTLYARTGDDQGAKFADAVVTDDAGMATIKNVPQGDYYLVEDEATKGYRKPARVKMTFTPPTTCGQNGTFTFAQAADDTEGAHQLFTYDAKTGVTTVQNKPILGSIEITKKANGDGAYGEPLQGVVFGLYRFGAPVMDNSDPAVPKPLTATTNADGVAVFENIAGGDYTVKEITPIEGYSTIDTQNTADKADDINLETTGVDVTVPADPEKTMVENRASKTLGNKTVTGKIRVIKQDDTGHPVSGAEFGLFKKVGNETAPAVDAEPQYKATTAKATLGPDGAPDPSATPEGEILFTEVPYGTWFVKELKAPTGYVATDKVATVTVRDQDRTYNATPSSAFINTVLKRDVKLVKKDTDTQAVLKGAKFGLYPCLGEVDPATNLAECGDAVPDGHLARYEATSGEDGTLLFSQVAYGKYLLKEIEAPEGYVLSTAVHKVTVDEGEDLIDLTATPVTNERQKGSVTLKKVDSLDNARTLPGVTFALYEKQDDGQAKADVFTHGEKTFERQTAADGTLTFEGVPLGAYILKEKATITGYTLGTDAREVEITQAGQQVNFTAANVDHPEQGWFTNAPKLHTLTVTKVDAADQNPLRGATFTLYPARQENGEWVKSGAAVGAAQTTGDDGIVRFADLRMGDYLLEETTAPTGYNAAAPLHVNANGTDLAIARTVENAMILRDIVFTKVDAAEYEKDPKVIKPLSGVVFDLYRGVLRDGKYVKDGVSLAQVTTGDDGVVRFTEVGAGHYVIEETTAKEGYVPAKDTIHVEVTPGVGEISATQDGYFANTLIVGSVRVTKTGETADGGSTPVADVRFELRQGDTVVGTAETNAQGVATFAGIEYGNYTLVETAAPDQYVVDSTPQAVSITEHGAVVEKTAHNALKKGTVQVTKRVDGKPDSRLAGAVFELKQGDAVKYTLPATNDQGSAELANVPYGAYKLVEKTAPEGYQLSTATLDVNITENGQRIEHTVDNSPITGTVVVKKLGTLDAAGTETKPLQGVVFELTPVANSGVNLGAVTTAVTDQDGLATFVNVPYGTYTIAEKTGVAGYNTTDKTVQVKVTEHGTTYGYKEGADNAADYTFTNTIIRNDVRLTKVDGATNVPLAGAHLALFRCIGTGGDVCATTEDAPAYEGDTAQDGSLLLVDVLYGTYQLRETAAPAGYLRTEATATVTVSEQKNADASNPVTPDAVQNTRIRGSVELWKANAETPAMMVEGARFALVPVAEDGSDLDEATRAAFDTDAAAGANYQATSGKDGRVEFANIAAGTYRLVEEQAATGYLLPTQEELNAQVSALAPELASAPLIVISENGKMVTLGAADKPVTNAPIKGSLLFHKVSRGCDVSFDDVQPSYEDADAALAVAAEKVKECRGLPGAVFVLRPVENTQMPTPFGDAEAYTFTAVSSDDEATRGLVRFDGVPYGTYELLETRAPRGYFKSDEVRRVVVSAEGVQVLEPVENMFIPLSDPKPPVEPEQPVQPETPAEPTPAVPAPPVNPKAAKGYWGKGAHLASTGATADAAGIMGLAFLLLGLFGLYLRRFKSALTDRA